MMQRALTQPLLPLRKTHCTIFPTCLFWIACVCAPSCPAAEIQSVELGFAGKYRVGHWTLARVEITNVRKPQDASIQIVTADGNGDWCRFESQCQIDSAKSNLAVYIKPGRIRSSLRVRIVGQDGDLADRVFSTSEISAALPSQQSLVLCVGEDTDVQKALQLRGQYSQEKVAFAQVTHASQLPDRWIGYAGVSLIVLPTRSNHWIDHLSAEQITALKMWLRQGGRILVSCATRGDELLQNGPLQHLIPGTYLGTVHQKQTRGIEEFVGAATSRLDVSIDGRPFQLPLSRIENVDGKILVSEGLGTNRLPAIVTGAMGFGKSVFVAFDLDSPQLAAWPGRAELVRRLIDEALGSASTEERSETAGNSRAGFNDLVGQLRFAQGQFSGVQLVPFSIVAGLVVIYLLVVGPLDFLIHQKLTKRFEFTWVTFPLSVVVFCLAAYGIATNWKADRIKVNRITLTDIDMDSGEVFSTSWSHIYSPQSTSFTVAEEPLLVDLKGNPACMLSWQGLPGKGFAGMRNPMMGRPSTGSYAIPFSKNGTRIDGLMVDVASSKSLFGQWTSTIQPSNDRRKTELKAEVERQLSGRIFNPLTVDLQSCLLVYDRWAYALGTLNSETSTSLAGRKVRDIKSLLTKQEFVEGRYVLSSWDQEETDINRIMEMMMLYDAINGEAYTHLAHDYQNHVDVSHLLKLGRAVLIGRSETPPDRLVLNGQSIEDQNTYSVFRLSFSVRQEEPEGSNL